MAADVIVEGDYYAQVPEWLLNSDFSSNAVKLYAILRRYADKSTKMAHPSRKTLADRMGFTRPASVDAAIKELADKGALETFPRYRVNDDGKPTPERTSNGYRLFTTRRTSSTTEVVVENVPPSTPDRMGVVPETVGGVVPKNVRGVVRQTVQQNHSHLEPQSVEPQSVNKPPSPATPTTVGFDEFWKLYPRKKGKEAARTSYHRALKKTSHDNIVAGVQAHLPEWELKEQDKIPHPATWLNQGRWDDVVEITRPTDHLAEILALGDGLDPFQQRQIGV